VDEVRYARQGDKRKDFKFGRSGYTTEISTHAHPGVVARESAFAALALNNVKKELIRHYKKYDTKDQGDWLEYAKSPIPDLKTSDALADKLRTNYK
jgi:hypothetical protein